MTSGTSNLLYSVRGCGSSVFAVGFAATVLRYSYTTTCTITAAADTGGSISPSGEVTVEYWDSQTFTITPKAGFRIDNITVDGVSAGVVSPYSFPNVMTNHTISASFREQLLRCPNVVKASLSQAQRTLDQAGLRVGNVTRIPLPWWKRWMWWLMGTVAYQNPRGGTMVPTGSRVDLGIWS